LATGGPGLDLDPADWGPLFRRLPGSQDHRGQIIEPLDYQTALEAAKELAKEAQTIVVGAKFGPKNPALEKTMLQADLAATTGPVLAASRLFGRLNFARRLGGAVLNGAVQKLYESFLGALRSALAERRLGCEVFVLKADGGVMSVEEALERPVLALAAGPAASLLGLWALSGAAAPDQTEDALMIDMGGTSSDLAILSQGRPLLTPEGLTLAGRPTLVRGLLTHSLALGGDTDLTLENGAIAPKAVRRGPALALDPDNAPNRPPTLTDALNVLGRCEVGDPAISTAAFKRLRPAAPPEKTAQEAVDAVLAKLKEAYDDFLARVNDQPVYTISEFLVDYRLEPKKAAILGGPAATLAPLVAEALKLPATAPPEAATANALGAALARPTSEAELYADTAAGTLTIPTLGIQRQIGSRYSLDEAKAELLKAMGEPTAQIVFAEIFNQVSDYGESGRVMRAKAQTAPGLVGQANRP
jgi:N-methylhydantoinase A/oxoprolinase/acetone carboxylase beta subunit